MGTTLEDSLFDFNINLLPASPNAGESWIDKVKRQISMVKKRSIGVNRVIEKHNAYKLAWDESEVDLKRAKEECKQVCIDYKNSMDKCAQLEKNIETLSKQNTELNSMCTSSQNQYEGLKSYANQLQILLKERESVIEALKIEKQLEKNDSVDYEATLSSLRKEKKGLLKHLRLLNNIALGKKKLRDRHKELLRKYDFKDVSSEDDSSSDDNSDFFDEPPQSPLLPSPKHSAAKKTEQDFLKPTKLEITIKKDSIKFNEDNDSDNEVVSEDTGCGSSITFSDPDKCFSSPDYFNNDSPENILRHGKTKENIVLIDSSTSPSRSHEAIHVATSPHIFDDVGLFTDNNTLYTNDTDIDSPEYYISEIPLSDEIVTIKEKRKLIDIGTSPIRDMEKVTIATSPLLFEECADLDDNNIDQTVETDGQESNVNDDFTTDKRDSKVHCILNENLVNLPNPTGKHTVIDNLTSHCELEISGQSIEERKCLERNNSKNVCDENSDDDEIDTILSTMRFNQRFLTPIPDTPVKMHKNERQNVQKLVENAPEISGEHSVCRESLILREENKILHKDMSDLKKNVMDIKCLLQNFLLGNISKGQISHELDIGVHPETFDDTSQETVIVYANDNNSNNVNNETGASSLNFSNALRKELSTENGEANENNCINEITRTSSSSHDVSEKSPHFIVDDNDVLDEAPLYIIDESSASTDDSAENEIRSARLHNDVQVTTKDSREIITYEEDIRSDTESDMIINNGVDNTTNDLSLSCSGTKKKKNKKLSKLDKFKKKLQPKSKISNPMIGKTRQRKYKLKPIIEITQSDAAAILNNKSAYENAAKVMAELKLKEKDSANQNRVTRKVNITVNDKNVENNDNDCEKPVSERNIRRKSNDPQDLIDKNIQSINDVDMQNIDDMPLSSITTRSRSRKLSFNSLIDVDTTKKDSTKSEEKQKIKNRLSNNNSPMLENKRVLRSSNNRMSLVDLEKTISNENENLIPNTPYTKRKRNSKDEKQYASGSDTSGDAPKTLKTQTISDTCIQNRKRKLSTNNIDKQNLNDNDFSLVSNKMIGRRLSKTEVQDITNNNKNYCVVLDKLENERIFQSINGKQNVTSNITNASNTSNDHQVQKVPHVNRETQESTKTVHVTNEDSVVGEVCHPKHSILCKMLEKHGRGEKKASSQKVPDNVTNTICKQIEQSIAGINKLPAGKVKLALNTLVDDVESWDTKHFMAGFIAYLKSPERKAELYNKVNSPPAPPMTKSEQVVLYIVSQMELTTPNTVNTVLTYIEYSLFQLNRSPEFDVIESLSHVYALLCRYFGLKSRLRLFLLDAMYCLQFKVVPLVKQCLDVWMHILPLAHMGIAKSPLVTCLVYLLHFYKCEDRFNRAREIRTILNQKYFYSFGDWNEPKILEMFRNAIKEVRDIPLEKKMLRMAFILLGKRHGPKWCHKNIIKNMLMPLLESNDTSVSLKQFCVQTLGALLKPFPADMKVDLEISINYMFDMLKQNPPHTLKEAIFTSLIYVNHHNPGRVTRELLLWTPKQVSPELEALLRDYVRAKKLTTWKQILSKIIL